MESGNKYNSPLPHWVIQEAQGTDAGMLSIPQVLEELGRPGSICGRDGQTTFQVVSLLQTKDPTARYRIFASDCNGENAGREMGAGQSLASGGGRVEYVTKARGEKETHVHQIRSEM